MKERRTNNMTLVERAIAKLKSDVDNFENFVLVKIIMTQELGNRFVTICTKLYNTNRYYNVIANFVYDDDTGWTTLGAIINNEDLEN